MNEITRALGVVICYMKLTENFLFEKVRSDLLEHGVRAKNDRNDDSK